MINLASGSGVSTKEAWTSSPELLVHAEESNFLLRGSPEESESPAFGTKKMLLNSTKRKRRHTVTPT